MGNKNSKDKIQTLKLDKNEKIILMKNESY